MSTTPTDTQVSMRAFVKLAQLLEAAPNSRNQTFFSKNAIQLAVDLIAERKPDLDRMSALALRPSADNDMLVVEFGEGIDPNDTGMLLISRGGALATALDENTSAVVQDVSKDAVLGLDRSLMKYASAAVIPTRIVYGRDLLLIFLHPTADYFDPVTMQLLDIIALQTANAIQKHQLVKAIRLDDDRVLQVHNESRKLLSRALHDGPAQNMAALTMRANFARRMLDQDIERAKQELMDIEKLARETTKTIRYMLFTMRPLVLETRGLKPALMNLAEKIKTTYGQEVFISIAPNLPLTQNTDINTILFYIAEEAVINAQKHAAAQNIFISVYAEEADVVLEVSDDGVGLNIGQITENYDQRGSLGMVNMRERAELINGVFNVDSIIHEGTTISVRVPIKEFEEEAA